MCSLTDHSSPLAGNGGGQALAAAALQQIRDRPGVSNDTFEVASKTLMAAVTEEDAVAEVEAAATAEPQQ